MGDAAGEARDRLLGWVEKAAGLRFPEVHSDTVRAVARRMSAEAGLDDDAWFLALLSDPETQAAFLDEIVIGETYFFRDERQFDALLGRVLPETFGRTAAPTAWSATCATGEEAVSLLASFERARLDLGLGPSYRVIATDLCAASLSRLSRGTFPASSFRGDGSRFHAMLDLVGSREAGSWRLRDEALARLDIRRANVLGGAGLPEPGSVDVAFFRNTLVYMRDDSRERALDSVVRSLAPGGWLFLASPEVPTIRHPALATEESHGCFYFRRVAETAFPLDGRRSVPGEVARDRKRTGAAAAPRAGRARSIPRPADRSAAVGGAVLERAIALANAVDAGTLADPSAEGEAGRVAKLLLDALFALRAEDGPAFASALGRFEATCGETYVLFYLKGLAACGRGEASVAAEAFERARIYEPGFWPATLRAGMALVAADPERAAALLREAAELAERDRGAWSSLVDGFDGRRYASMARALEARALAGGRGVAADRAGRPRSGD